MAVMDAYDRVTITTQALRNAEMTLRAEMERKLATQLKKLRDEQDAAIRHAYDTLDNKSAIARAMGMVGRVAVNESLTRTEGMEPERVEGEDRFMIDKETYDIHIWNDGWDALFQAIHMAEGAVVLQSYTPLWNEDYSVKNPVVAKYDGMDIANTGDATAQSIYVEVEA